MNQNDLTTICQLLQKTFKLTNDSERNKVEETLANLGKNSNPFIEALIFILSSSDIDGESSLCLCAPISLSSSPSHPQSRSAWLLPSILILISAHRSISTPTPQRPSSITSTQSLLPWSQRTSLSSSGITSQLVSQPSSLPISVSVAC